MAQITKSKKPKNKENSIKGIVYIQSTFNNTIITITNWKGNTISWASGGSAGFKGSRKSTPYAAQIIAEKASLNARNYGIKKVRVLVKGQGPGRETAIRAIQKVGFQISMVKDNTSIPHNGCRCPKKRRV